MFKNYPTIKERMGSMVNIIKQKIVIEASLKNKLKSICDFYKVKYTIINGTVRI